MPLEAIGVATVPGMSPPAGDVGLEEFRARTAGTLTREDRILIVEQAIQMLDHFYVHRPLKEAMHAVRPIQRLRVLMRRLQQDQRSVSGKEELAFHNQVTSVFISVRDLHTNYLLPSPYRDYIAYLPFSVSAFYEEGVRKYLVTRIMPGYQFAAPGFAVGSEICHWNGMPIESAVAANAERRRAATKRPGMPAAWTHRLSAPERRAPPRRQLGRPLFVPQAKPPQTQSECTRSGSCVMCPRRRSVQRQPLGCHPTGWPRLSVGARQPPPVPPASREHCHRAARPRLPPRSALTTPHRTHSRRSTSIATPSPGPLIRSWIASGGHSHGGSYLTAVSRV